MRERIGKRRVLKRVEATQCGPSHGLVRCVDPARSGRAFAGQVPVAWAREDELMSTEHAARLADWFENTELVWVDDSRTLIPVDQPEVLAAYLERFLDEFALRVTCSRPPGARGRRTTRRHGKATPGVSGGRTMGRHQTGIGRNRSTGSLGGVMADTPVSRRRTGGRRS